MAPLPFLRGAFHAISAHGELWAPVVVVETRHLAVHQLDDDGCWSEFASVISVDFLY